MSARSRSEDTNEDCDRSYTINYSDKTTAVTVDIHNEDFFNELKQRLNDKYLFTQNKNKNGLEATLYEDGKKIVLNLYPTTTTLFVQGSGYKQWMENIFEDIADQISAEISTVTIDSTQSDASNDLNLHTPPFHHTLENEDNSPKENEHNSPQENEHNSPLTGLRIKVNSLRSPSKRTPRKTTQHCHKNKAKNKKQCKNPKLSDKCELNTEENEITCNDENPLKIPHSDKEINEECGVEESPPQPCENNVNNSNALDMEETELKTPHDDQQAMCKKLKEELTDKNRLVKTLESEVACLKKKSAESTGKCTNLEEEIALLKQKVSEINNAYESKDREETALKTPHEMGVKRTINVDLQDEKRALQSKLKAKCDIVDKLESELAYTKKKSLTAAKKCENLEEELAKHKLKEKESADRCKKLENENSAMKNKISKLNGDVMILEEGKSKLMTKISDLNKERHTLQTELIKSNSKNENIEDKIQEMAQSMEMKVSDEVSHLKEVFLKEVVSMKSQISACQKAISTKPLSAQTTTSDPRTNGQSRNSPRNSPPPVTQPPRHTNSEDMLNDKREQRIMPESDNTGSQENHQNGNQNNYCETSIDQRRYHKNPSNNNRSYSAKHDTYHSDRIENQNKYHRTNFGGEMRENSSNPYDNARSQMNDQRYFSSTKSAIILGDSMTSRLSAKRMSNDKLQVRIRSYPGYKIENVEHELNNLDNESHVNLKNSDAVILHLGTNNVSNADSASEVANKMESVVSTVKSINTKAKIVVSGILPRKNNILLNKFANKANEALQCLCNKNGYHFVPHSDDYILNGRIDDSLFHDNIHLNAKGGHTFGTRLRKSLDEVVFNESRQSVRFREDNLFSIPSFVNGRQTGSRKMNSSQDRTQEYTRTRHRAPVPSNLKSNNPNHVHGSPQVTLSTPHQQMNNYPQNISMSTDFPHNSHTTMRSPTNVPTSTTLDGNNSPLRNVYTTVSSTTQTMDLPQNIYTTVNSPTYFSSKTNSNWNNNPQETLTQTTQRYGSVQPHQGHQSTVVQYYPTNGYLPHTGTYASAVNTNKAQNYQNYVYATGASQWDNWN